jgi:hypothetical protein
LELKDHICKDESTSCAPLLEREKCGAERKINKMEEKTRSKASRQNTKYFFLTQSFFTDKNP